LQAQPGGHSQVFQALRHLLVDFVHASSCMLYQTNR
jgi:hypothetical protein